MSWSWKIQISYCLDFFCFFHINCVRRARRTRKLWRTMANLELENYTGKWKDDRFKVSVVFFYIYILKSFSQVDPHFLSFDDN